MRYIFNVEAFLPGMVMVGFWMAAPYLYKGVTYLTDDHPRRTDCGHFRPYLDRRDQRIRLELKSEKK